MLSELTEVSLIILRERAGLPVYQGENVVIVLVSVWPAPRCTTIQSGFFPFLLSEVLQLRPHHSLHISGVPLTTICFLYTGVDKVDHFNLQRPKAQSPSEFQKSWWFKVCRDCLVPPITTTTLSQKKYQLLFKYFWFPFHYESCLKL